MNGLDGRGFRMPGGFLLERWREERPLHRAALLALFVLGFGIRFAYLFQPMVHDEAATFVYFASRPLSTALSYYPYPNNHLLNTLLVHLSTKVLGNEPWVVRLPAFVAALLVMPVAYILIRRLFGRTVALLALALVATSSHLIFYATSSRGYSLQALIFLLLVWVGLDLLGDPRRSSWVAFCVLSALGFYVVPTMLFLFLSLVGWLAVSKWRAGTGAKVRPFLGKLALTCGATGGIVAIMYLPVLLRPDTRFKGVGAHVAATWWEFSCGFVSRISALWSSWSGDMPLFAAIALLAGFLVCMAFYRRAASGGEFNLFLVVIFFFLLITVPLKMLTLRRTWMPLLPLYYGWSVAGLCLVVRELRSRLPARLKGNDRVVGPSIEMAAVAVAMMLAVAVLFSGSPHQPPGQITHREAEEVAVCLKAILRPGDLVYMEPNVRKSLEYYAQREGLPLECFYGYRGMEQEPAVDGRIIFIDVGQKRFPPEKTIDWSGVPIEVSDLEEPFAWFGRSRVYVLNVEGDGSSP